MNKLTDRYNRIHDYLRFSVTDKCNLNCVYCNPHVQSIKHLRNDNMLTTEESVRLIGIFVKHFGFKKIRFTGGEPLARKDIVKLISKLKPLNRHLGLEIGLTTNGTMLKENLELLKYSGVSRLNISLDTLRNDRFKHITGKDKLDDVIESILLAEYYGFRPLKINCVIMKGINDDEILDFVGFVLDRKINLRFIEYMPFSGNGWHEGKFMAFSEIKTVVEREFELLPDGYSSENVAENFLIKDHIGEVGFISSISNHFCGSCSRLRVTSEGSLKLCLFSSKSDEMDMKQFLRAGNMSDLEIAYKIQNKLLEKNYSHPEISELLQMEKNSMLSIGG